MSISVQDRDGAFIEKEGLATAQEAKEKKALFALYSSRKCRFASHGTGTTDGYYLTIMGPSPSLPVPAPNLERRRSGSDTFCNKQLLRLR